MNKVRDVTILSKKPTTARQCIREDSLFVLAIWYLCRTFGLLPLTIQTVKRQGMQRVWMASYSTVWMVYSWIIIALLGPGSIYGIMLLVTISSDDAKGKPSLGLLLAYFSHGILILITALVGCASCRRHAKDLIRAKLLIEKVDTILAWSPVPKLKDRKFNAAVITQIVVTGAVITADVYHLFVIFHDNMLIPSVFICNFLVYGVTCAMMVRIVSTIYPLKKTFIYVSDIAKSLNKDLLTNPNKDCTGVLFIKVSTVVQARMLTSKAASILGRDQSSSAFVIILLIIFRASYYTTFLVIDATHEMDVSRAVIYVCCEIVKLISLVETCYQVSEESNKWISIGAEMLSKVCDPDLRDDIKLSVRSASYDPLKFVAFGTFVINRELLSMVGGVIISTVLILVQVA